MQYRKIEKTDDNLSALGFSSIIAAKLPPMSVSKTEDINSILDNQLKRLQTESIDYSMLQSIHGDLWEKMKKATFR